jgi:hypothetical protein
MRDRLLLDFLPEEFALGGDVVGCSESPPNL